MKRKLLLRFADWLEASRTPFNITDAQKCVSQHALRFAEKFDLPGKSLRDWRMCGSNDTDLVRIFDMPDHEANLLYSAGFDWAKGALITRKVAANVIRRLARTGKVRFGEFTDLDLVR